MSRHSNNSRVELKPFNVRVRVKLPKYFFVKCELCTGTKELSHSSFSGLGYVCMSFIALITALVLCARSQDPLMSVSARRVHVAFSTAGLKGGG